jgi:hypothetical protein
MRYALCEIVSTDDVCGVAVQKRVVNEKDIVETCYL